MGVSAQLLEGVRMFLLLISLSLFRFSAGRSSGPPSCTLKPAGPRMTVPQTTSWRQFYKITFYNIHESKIMDLDNIAGMSNENANGWLVVITPITNKVTIKGFAVQADSSIYFPVIKMNTKLKKLKCNGEKNMLSHKDAKPKDSVSFFFRYNSSYLKNGLQLFEATILDSYGKYWENVRF